MKISAEQLEAFASTSMAKNLLPELLRRLVRASSARLEDIYFPSGESTFRPGADGLVQAVGSPPFVPEGISVWELSAEKNPHQKGRDDFNKRSLPEALDDYLGSKRSDITYVAVSLRRWNTVKGVDRDGLETDLRKRGVWKQVKILDAEHLEDWLDQCPAVSTWLARRLKLVSEDMKSIEDFWEDYRTGITPAMTPELLLLNREQNAQTLIEGAIRGDFSRVKADSPREAAGFVAAAVLSLPEKDPRRETLLAKGVVITKKESDAFLTDNPQFVIALEGAVDVATQLASRGHTVVAAFGNAHTSRGNNSPLITLRRPKRDEFIQALVAMKLGVEEARRVADECHCSITVLYRTRDLSHTRRPEWATRAQLGKLLGLIFSGAFRHVSQADMAVVAALGQVDVGQLKRDVLDVLGLDDAPVLREGDLTVLSAPVDIWQLSIDQSIIDREVLARFQVEAIKVLGERDPALDLPPEQRPYAALHGKQRVHSDSLRRGFTEVLRLIAINAEHLDQLDGHFCAQHFVDGILRDLPGLELDYQTLASLDSLLPDLAEVASTPFLSALETLSTGDGSKLSPIFEGSDDAVFGKTYYLGMLRALEVLAWDPATLLRTSLLLARLAELDPGGKLNNRPINSLSHVFLPWRPQTNASQQARQLALTKVCQEHPSVAWTLLSGLLPTGHAISFGSAEPQWREMGASRRPTPTYESVAQDEAFVIQLAIPLAEAIPQRWMSLLEAAVRRGDEALLGRLLGEIEGQTEAFIAQGQDKLMWESLSSLVRKHRAFRTAQWAMPEAMVARVEAAATAFKPQDAISLYRHLFNSSIIERLNTSETYEQRTARAERERDAAVKEVASQGFDAVMELARQVATPGLIAPSLVRTSSATEARAFVLASFNQDAPVAWLAAFVMAQGAHVFGAPWAIETMDRVEAAGATAAQFVSLLLPWDDTPALFDLVDSKPQDVRDEYWRRREAFVRSDDEALVGKAVASLVEHDRAVELVSFVGGRLGKHDSQTLLGIVEHAFDEVVADPKKAEYVDRYWLGEIFTALRERTDVERERLMGLEYRWLPALHTYGEKQSFALHDYLGENPEFFVQVLSDVYRSEEEAASESTEETPADAGLEDQVRGKAEIGYKLLESWQTLPGQQADGSIDESRLFHWVQQVLQFAQQAGRLQSAEREVGKLLAYSSVDPQDQLWPSAPVRGVIEALANTDVEQAVVIELFNKRGVHTRPHEGGGAPERELANQANATAQALQAQWPRTAHVLRDSAQGWLDYAEREDRRAAEKRIRL